MRTIGVLGGMGPEATAEFYRRLVRIFQRAYGCVNDADYPEIFIFNLPLPDVVDDVASEKEVVRALQYGFDKLTVAGADFIVSPCNTANTYFGRIRARVPVLNIIDEVYQLAKKSKKTGILATRKTVLSGVFQRRLNVEEPTDVELDEITGIITNILAGRKLKSDKDNLLKIVTRFRKEGCDSVILGCTELPLLFPQKKSPLRIFDSLEILADATVRYSGVD